MSEVVYFVKGHDKIKVGFTKNLKSRLGAISCGSPLPIELIATVPGGRDLERILHEKLKAHRKLGEWFEDCADVRRVIDDLVSGNPEAFRPPTAAVEEPVQPAPPVFDDDDKLTSVLENTQYRFSKILTGPLVNEVIQAAKLEKSLGLGKGKLVCEIVENENGEFRRAYDIATRCYRKFLKVTDRAIIVAFDESPEAPLALAAEVLIKKSESAFRELVVKKPELQVVSAP